MKIGEKSRRRKLEMILICHPFAQVPGFRELCAKVAAERPRVVYSALGRRAS